MFMYYLVLTTLCLLLEEPFLRWPVWLHPLRTDLLHPSKNKPFHAGLKSYTQSMYHITHLVHKLNIIDQGLKKKATKFLVNESSKSIHL